MVVPTIAAILAVLLTYVLTRRAERSSRETDASEWYKAIRNQLRQEMEANKQVLLAWLLPETSIRDTERALEELRNNAMQLVRYAPPAFSFEMWQSQLIHLPNALSSRELQVTWVYYTTMRQFVAAVAGFEDLRRTDGGKLTAHYFRRLQTAQLSLLNQAGYLLTINPIDDSELRTNG